MKKSITSALIAAVLIIPQTATSTKAQIDDAYSYFQGAAIGAGMSICGLLATGLISRQVAASFNKAAFRQFRKDAPYGAIDWAIQSIKEDPDFSDCPIE